MPHDHYQFLVHELDTLRVGIDSEHEHRLRLVAERDALRAERDRLRGELAECRERLSYHMRRASIMACGGCD